MMCQYLHKSYSDYFVLLGHKYGSIKRNVPYSSEPFKSSVFCSVSWFLSTPKRFSKHLNISSTWSTSGLSRHHLFR